MNTDWDELKDEIQDILNGYESEYGPFKIDNSFHTIISRLDEQISLAEKCGAEKAVDYIEYHWNRTTTDQFDRDVVAGLFNKAKNL